MSALMPAFGYWIALLRSCHSEGAPVTIRTRSGGVVGGHITAIDADHGIVQIRAAHSAGVYGTFYNDVLVESIELIESRHAFQRLS